MAWTEPAYSRSQVNDAGVTLGDSSASPRDNSRARTIINNWRASHSFPLNALQMNLRNTIAGFGEAALVAQRLKRMSSIEAKLRRAHHMQLARMHDIGGCRAVLPFADDVLDVVRRCDKSRALHEPLRRYDYLTSPRDSGYRGVHLVYGYRTRSHAHALYAGMRIEIQLRSRLQHAWATAVETVGTFSGQALKSSEGHEAWLRFFSLMATELACTEGLPPVPGTPADRGTLRRELTQLAAELDAVARLEAYGHTLRILEGDVRNGRAAYFHIVPGPHRRERPLERVLRGRARGSHSRLRGGRDRHPPLPRRRDGARTGRLRRGAAPRLPELLRRHDRFRRRA